MDLTGLTEEVKALAVEAGHKLTEARRNFKAESVEQKRTHDYVSYVDKKSEQFITERLHKLLPQAGFIAEESAANHVQQEEYCWLVDPLDGTSNFIRNNAPYCVSIALRNKKEVLLGAVYECGRNELFWANIHSKAYLNGSEIHVTHRSDLDQSFIQLGFPYDAETYRPFVLELIRSLYGHVGCLRLQGAAAAELCYIAAGRFEARIEALLGPWDIAAGSVILRQAGGVMTRFDGNSDCLDAKEVLATNGALHPALLQILLKHRHLLYD